MTFVDERGLTDRALASLRRESPSHFPPVAERIRAARQRLGVSEAEVARRWGVEPSLYRDLELHDDELFTCVDFGNLAALAATLELPLMVLLFGEEPAARPVELEYRDVAERLKSRLSNEAIGVDALSEAVGWELQGVLEDPATLATFNIVGVYDVCCAVGVGWLGLVEHEQMVSHSRSHRAFRRDAIRDWSRTVSKVGGSCSRDFVFTRIVLNV